jgi:23S rRNA (pseudouridine1915-N3)-methyltransferase
MYSFLHTGHHGIGKSSFVRNQLYFIKNLCYNQRYEVGKMKITIIAVGKIKEKYFTGAIEEYAKRLSRYCKLELVEVADEKTPDGASEALELQIKEKEGERILQKIPDNAFVAALAIEGKMLDSEELADQMERWNVGGISHMVFVIGGSLGLAPSVLKRADYKLSFSKMTFPHQLMRVILLEQIYRSFRIRNHEPYHK